MEILVKLNKIEDLEVLNNADSYLVANRKFSYRFDKSFCINKIRKVKAFCKQHNKKVYVLVNKIFKDHELDELKLFLEKLIKIDVDGIYFTDFAVFMILKELNAEHKCVFYHETFLRNTYDILTYQEIGIKKIVCSKDMHIDDIKNLPIKKKDSYGILCFGYIPLYESERKIISNYIELNDLPKKIVNSKTLTLKENTRNEHYKVLQQEGISSIFESKVLSYINHIDVLKTHINTFIIDSLFFKTDYIYNVINIFKDALNGIDVKGKIEGLDSSISFTDGFLNERIGLM